MVNRVWNSQPLEPRLPGPSQAHGCGSIRTGQDGRRVFPVPRLRFAARANTTFIVHICKTAQGFARLPGHAMMQLLIQGDAWHGMTGSIQCPGCSTKASCSGVCALTSVGTWQRWAPAGGRWPGGPGASLHRCTTAPLHTSAVSTVCPFLGHWIPWGIPWGRSPCPRIPCS